MASFIHFSVQFTIERSFHIEEIVIIAEQRKIGRRLKLRKLRRICDELTFPPWLSRITQFLQRFYGKNCFCNYSAWQLIQGPSLAAHYYRSEGRPSSCCFNCSVVIQNVHSPFRKSQEHPNPHLRLLHLSVLEHL